MKKLVLSGMVLFASVITMAQQKEAPQQQPPVITKGYYSIGNNAQKLVTPSAPVLTTEASAQSTAPAKGYFAIGNNRKKMATQTKINPGKRKVVVTKGYYSIGNNAERLQY
jgi:hypothetical protein